MPAHPLSLRRAALGIGAGACVALLASCTSGPERDLRKGLELQQDGHYAEAIERFERVLDRTPGDPEASYRLGMALIQSGRPHLAVWPLERATASPAYRVQAGLLLTTAFQQTQSYDAAIDAATQVLEHAPESIGALALRAVAHESARNLEQALSDVDAILARDPRHFQAHLIRGRALAELGRLDEAERALELLQEVSLESDDPAAGAACAFLVHFLVKSREDLERAEQRLLRCVEAFPDDLVVLNDVTGFYDARGEPGRANEILEELVREDPDAVHLRAVLAHRLRSLGEGEKGLALLRESAETLGTPGAWHALVSYHLAANELEPALEASARALEADTSDNEALRFSHAEILIETGRLEEAEAVAASLGEPAYRDLVRGHILYERGDLNGARDALEAGLALWPNHPGARQVAGEVALALGDVKSAESHLLEAVRATEGDHAAAFDLVRLLLARGEAERALHYARMAGRHPALRMEAHLLAAQASAALGHTEEARRWLEPLLAVPAQKSAAVVALAAVERQEGGPRRAVERIESSGLDTSDPEHERVLRVLVDNLVASGRGSEALDRIAAALAREPESASLHDLRGRVLLRLGRTEEAGDAFEQALALDPDDAGALEGSAALLAGAGELERAVERLDRAAERDPSQETYPYRAAQLVRRAGDPEQALHRLDDIVRRFPGAAAARNDLAWALAEQGVDLDYAAELAQQAVRTDPQPAFFDTLGWVQLKRGQAEAAIVAFERALAAEPDSALFRYHLGLALAAADHSEQALEALRHALDGGLGGEAEQARAKIAELEAPSSPTP